MSKRRGLATPDEDFRYAGTLIYGAEQPEMKIPPWFLEEEHLLYLDDIRESGVTYMYCAAPFLQREFSLPEKTALFIFCYWMATFDDRHPREE